MKISEHLEQIIGTDVVCVWSCYILGNVKQIYAKPSEQTMWEVTYDRDKNRYYVDKYQKVDNQVIEI